MYKRQAIVGARGRSAYGCEVAKVLAAALSRQGIQIISGMARGIDRDAHMGCLEAGGNTYAAVSYTHLDVYKRQGLQTS